MGDEFDSESASPRTSRAVLAVLTLCVALAIVVPGALALSSNQSASDLSECRSLYAWVVCFMLAICLAAVLLVLAMCTKYATQGPDLRNPAGARPNVDLEEALDAKNIPGALKHDTTFRCGLASAGLLVVTFFLWGCVVYARNTCGGHSDLHLYFKFTFWLFIVILPPCALCGAIGNFFLGSSSASESFIAVDQAANVGQQTGPTDHALPDREFEEDVAVRENQSQLRSPSAMTSSRLETI